MAYWTDKGTDKKQNEGNEISKFIFNKTWNAIRKDVSLWMIPVESY